MSEEASVASPNLSPNGNLNAEERQELLALYGATVQDLAFFKRQQIVGANYSLLLYASIVGIWTRDLIGGPRVVPLIIVWVLLFVSILWIRNLQKAIWLRRERLERVFAQLSQRFRTARGEGEKPYGANIHFLLISIITFGAVLSSAILLSFGANMETTFLISSQDVALNGLGEFILQCVTAGGTLIIAALAIWGPMIQARWFGPKLLLSLESEKGFQVKRNGGTNTVYFHLSVENSRSWSPAQNIRVLVNRIEKRQAGQDQFIEERFPGRLQLAWMFPQHRPRELTIAKREICDLGHLDEGSNTFELEFYLAPNTLPGRLAANETMRVHIVCSGNNYEAKAPLIVEITWDGTWCEDLTQMSKHLVLREIQPGN